MKSISFYLLIKSKDGITLSDSILFNLNEFVNNCKQFVSRDGFTLIIVFFMND
jgi:hypothetical protein